MSLHDAAWAIREAMKVWEEAADMIADGAVGEVLDETLRHAKELLDIAEEEMAGIDGRSGPTSARSEEFDASSLMTEFDRSCLSRERKADLTRSPWSPARELTVL